MPPDAVAGTARTRADGKDAQAAWQPGQPCRENTEVRLKELCELAGQRTGTSRLTQGERGHHK